MYLLLYLTLPVGMFYQQVGTCIHVYMYTT